MTSLLLCRLFVETPQLFRTPVTPLDFQNEQVYSDRPYYLTGVSQIETDGERNDLSNRDDPWIVVIDEAGKVLQTIGKKGHGPGEFHKGIAGIAVAGDIVWVVDNYRQSISRFERGTFKAGFRLDAKPVAWFMHAAHVFDLHNETLVLPGSSQGKHLAVAYQGSGQGIRLGQTLPTHEFLPGVNDTMWQYADNRWYCVFKFTPLILIYDDQFREVKSIQLNAAQIDRYQALVGTDTHQNFSHFPVLFKDVQYYRGRLYLMRTGLTDGPDAGLIEVDPTTGNITAETAFTAEGPVFEAFPGFTNMTMMYFAILNYGKIVLANGSFLWNHDLWTAGVPFIEKRTRAERQTRTKTPPSP